MDRKLQKETIWIFKLIFKAKMWNACWFQVLTCKYPMHLFVFYVNMTLNILAFGLSAAKKDIIILHTCQQVFKVKYCENNLQNIICRPIVNVRIQYTFIYKKTGEKVHALKFIFLLWNFLHILQSVQLQFNRESPNQTIGNPLHCAHNNWL